MSPPPPPTFFLKIKPKQLRSEEFDDLITFRLMYPVPEGDFDELLELWDSSNSMSIEILNLYWRSYSIGCCVFHLFYFFVIYVSIYYRNRMSACVYVR